MNIQHLYKFNIIFIDKSNLKPLRWELTKYVLADNKSSAQSKLLEFYKECEILECNLIEVEQVYE